MLTGETQFSWGERTYVMGVLNTTPDSFSGDGTLRDGGGVARAVALAGEFISGGADVIDVGGESTRPRSMYPDANPVSADEERRRVVPVITELRRRFGVAVSIDTRKAVVARAAVAAGASIINDVSMLSDEEMAGVAAETGARLVISHIRPRAVYDDVVMEVAADLSAAVDRAVAAGVDRSRIIVDPGIGFGKNAGHSLAVLRDLRQIKELLGLPLLVGTSRKSFIGAVLDLPVGDRLEGSAATVALAIANGADMVRVHDVAAMVRTARMTDAVVRGWAPPDGS